MRKHFLKMNGVKKKRNKKLPCETGSFLFSPVVLWSNF